MNFGCTPVIGRHIIDIDGCLKSTDQTSLSAREILAIISRAPSETQVFVERYDELVPLGSNERVTLDQDTVQFFRTSMIAQHRHAVPGVSSTGQQFARAA
ncbi:MAG TPA: hypothetical protein VF503_29030 [Sphingobium sp.]|uniref:hypothetical protein n=1 Tax=Sphingobium sp. TaxID=1912891 RepID=UPI002ED04D06